MLQDYFGEKKEDCQVLGKPNEPIVFKSVGRSKSPHDENSRNAMLLQDGTKITTGDIITRPDSSIHLVKPIRKALYKNIVFGASVSETIEDLQQYIGGKDSQMQKYVGQVATDRIVTGKQIGRAHV